MHRIRFDLEAHPLPALVATALGEGDLSQLGERDHLPLRTRRTDQQTRWHRTFYRTFASWQSAYWRFVRDAVAPVVAEPFYVQAVPTLRVHLIGNVAVGEFHTDSKYGHPDGEVTVWLPLTEASGTNSLQLESAPGRGDFQSVRAVPGEAVLFDARNLEHGNVINTSATTRVSVDFRCLPVRCPGSPQRSVNAQLPFVPGGYYAAEVVAPAPLGAGDPIDD